MRITSSQPRLDLFYSNHWLRLVQVAHLQRVLQLEDLLLLIELLVSSRLEADTASKIGRQLRQGRCCTLLSASRTSSIARWACRSGG